MTRQTICCLWMWKTVLYIHIWKYNTSFHNLYKEPCRPLNGRGAGPGGWNLLWNKRLSSVASLVMEAVFCRWQPTAGPPSSATAMTLCGSGASVSFNHLNAEATKPTALHRRVILLPRAVINKHTTSLGVPQVVSVNTLNETPLSDGSKEPPYGHCSFSLLQSFQISSSILSHSLILHFSLYPPTSHPSRGLPSCSTVQTGQGTLDLIPHSPLPAGTIRSPNTPGEKWACYTYTLFPANSCLSPWFMYTPIQIHHIHSPFSTLNYIIL